MTAIMIMGLQWGDEGKGRIIDRLAGKADTVVRFNGGPNAGHTIPRPGMIKRAVHQLPSGALHDHILNVLGRGMVIDVTKLAQEMIELNMCNERLAIDPCAHTILPHHKDVDRLMEAQRSSKIGTTATGNGPAYADKASRSGLRLCDVMAKAGGLVDRSEISIAVEARAVARVIGFRDLDMCFTDVPSLLSEQMADNKRIIFECAHGFELDLDHGQYPYVTSSSCGIGGVYSGAGFDPRRIGAVIGVLKPYSTRVGAGPMPNEYEPSIAAKIREMGGEYGTTTGRPRRIGALDLRAIARACDINGVDYLALTHFDIAEEVKYVELTGRTGETRMVHHDALVVVIAEETGVPVKYITTGPKLGDMSEVGNSESIWEMH